MPELAFTPADLPAPALPPARPDGHEPPPGSTPYYITLTPDQVVQFGSFDRVEERALRGEFDAHHGENVIVAPDGTVLEHTDVQHGYSLLEALDRATEKAIRAGIPPAQLVAYYVTPLEYR